MEELKQTPLHALHLALGGKMVEFAGWEMPIQYEGITAEHQAVRNSAGLFDVSHMGEIFVQGEDALEFLQSMMTNDVSGMQDGQILYTLMCYPDGGVVDDLVIYRFSPERYLLIVNASNAAKDFAWLEDHRAARAVELVDRSEQLSLLALQGPKAQEILSDCTEFDLSRIQFFRFAEEVSIAGLSCLVSRTGYTGEDGFEICMRNEDAPALWSILLETGAGRGLSPCGLGARDTLRFEACLPLYGNELSPEINPLEAGLQRYVKLEKPDFIGKAALVSIKAAGLKRTLVGFELTGPGIARHGYDISVNGERIGFVTTGYHAPTLRKSIGLALVDPAYSALNQEMDIHIRQNKVPAKVIRRQFYTKRTRKS